MRSLHVLAAAGLAGVLVAGGEDAAAAPSDAPLGVVTPGPLRALFLDMPLADARGPSGPTVGVRWWTVNSWSVPTTLTRGGSGGETQLDAQIETLHLALAVPWHRLSTGGLAGRLVTTVEARGLFFWGGWSDGVIEAWHGLVRTTNFDRQRWPRDRVALRLAGAGKPRLIEARSDGFALGDVVLRSALRFAGAGPLEPPSRWTLAARLDVKLPTGSAARLGGSGGVDAGVGLAATFLATRRLTVHALASMRAVSGLPREVAIQPRRFQAGLDLSFVARLGSIALLLEDRISSPLFEDGWRLPDEVGNPAATGWYALFRRHNQVSLGVRWREVTAFVSEDFTPGRRLAGDAGPAWFFVSNAPDVVVGVTWERSL